jgi:D-beta-D-heptose 7-phosphate kinase/D-beta-D-heptose 1-phosphate adenosyltransferase
MTANPSVKDVLARIQGKRALIVGDVMVDEHIWTNVTRISPEAPVPVARVDRVTRTPGGAGNLAANVRSLGGTPFIVGVVGVDEEATALKEGLRAATVGTEGLVGDSSRPTTVKTRVIAHGQQVVRVDREVTEPVGPSVEQRLLEKAAEWLPEVDVLLLSDYAKGVLTPSLCQAIIQMARDSGKPIVVDPKGSEFGKYKGLTVITPNLTEAEAATGVAITDGESLEEAARRVAEQTRAEWVLITRGGDGMTLFSSSIEPYEVPGRRVEVFDVSGAGDTVAAVVALGVAAGADMMTITNLANEAGSLAVQKPGAVPVTLEELLAAVDGIAVTDVPSKVMPYDALRTLTEELRSQGKKIAFTNGCFDILHAGHVRYLGQARALADVLIVAVNSDESVRILKGGDRPIVPEAERAELVAALQCVDYVTTFSETAPERLVAELRPDFYVKGGDWAKKDLPEAAIVEGYGGQVVIVPEVDGLSTTLLISRILRAPGVKLGERGATY